MKSIKSTLLTLVKSVVISIFCWTSLISQTWQNMIPNYSFENLDTDFLRNDYNPLNITPFKDDDTSRYFKKENTTHSLNFQLFGPLFISSIGYAWENKFNEKLSLQFDAKLLGHTNIGGAGAYARSYFIGSSLSQSLLIGNKFKFKLGFIEGLAFNPPSINGAYTELNYWDRPPRMVYFVSFVVGCEIRLYKQIYLIPDAIISYGAYTRIKGTPPFEEKYSISGFAPSFGITLKIKI